MESQLAAYPHRTNFFLVSAVYLSVTVIFGFIEETSNTTNKQQSQQQRHQRNAFSC